MKLTLGDTCNKCHVGVMRTRYTRPSPFRRKRFMYCSHCKEEVIELIRVDSKGRPVLIDKHSKAVHLTIDCDNEFEHQLTQSFLIGIRNMTSQSPLLTEWNALIASLRAQGHTAESALIKADRMRPDLRQAMLEQVNAAPRYDASNRVFKKR